MNSPLLPSEFAWVSTGHLPTGEVVQPLVQDAHHRFRPVQEGNVADYIPALATLAWFPLHGIHRIHSPDSSPEAAPPTWFVICSKWPASGSCLNRPDHRATSTCNIIV